MSSTIYGRIRFREEQNGFEHIAELTKGDDKYPWLRREMFSCGSNDLPYYYWHHIVGFAATYKFVLEDLKLFVIKVERLLINLDFIDAIFHCELGLINHISLKWVSKANGSIQSLQTFYETENWYFGVSFRGKFNDEFDLTTLKFAYPIQVDDAFEEKVIKYIMDQQVNKKFTFQTEISSHPHFYLFLLINGSLRNLW